MGPVNHHRQHHHVKLNWDIAYIYIFHMYQQQILTAFCSTANRISIINHAVKGTCSNCQSWGEIYTEAAV